MPIERLCRRCVRACSGFSFRQGLGECIASLGSEFQRLSVNVGRILRLNDLASTSVGSFVGRILRHHATRSGAVERESSRPREGSRRSTTTSSPARLAKESQHFRHNPTQSPLRNRSGRRFPGASLVHTRSGRDPSRAGSRSHLVPTRPCTSQTPVRVRCERVFHSETPVRIRCEGDLHPKSTFRITFCWNFRDLQNEPGRPAPRRSPQAHPRPLRPWASRA